VHEPSELQALKPGSGVPLAEMRLLSIAQEQDALNFTVTHSGRKP
jgi:hypothetical protein